MDKKKERLYDLLTFVQKYNAFFKKKMQGGVPCREHDISTMLKMVPKITKKDIVENKNQYISSIEDKTVWELTSGTTGEPFKCYKTMKERMLMALVEWKERRKWDIEVKPSNFFPLMGVNEKYGIDFADFSDFNIIEIFKIIESEKSTWICGSPTTIYNYAKKIDEKVVSPITGLKFIELQGEYCDLVTRKYIEKIFGCKTIMHYGNRECWAIAYECKCGKLHVMDNIIVENELNTRGVNSLVVTNLLAKKMPFIRYCTNDIGYVRNEKCECGKETQIIYLDGGRKASLVTGYDLIGDIVFKKIIHNVINKDRIEEDIIRRYRIEQIGLKEFLYYIDKGKDFVSSYLDEITIATKKTFGDDVKVVFSEDYEDTKKKYRIFEPFVEKNDAQSFV